VKAVFSALLPVSAVLLALLIANLMVSFGTASALEALSVHALSTENIEMVEPDSTTLETAWCFKTDPDPPRLPFHTKVTVTTARKPDETPAEQLARHSKRIAEQLLITPNNCTEHTYP